MGLVAKIGPSKPRFTSFGTRPLWSICAWVRMHGVKVCRTEGECPVVELLLGFRALEHPTIDQHRAWSV